MRNFLICQILYDYQFDYGVTVSKAWGDTITTYGVGVSWEVGIRGVTFSFGKKMYGRTNGASYYTMLLINKNAKALYNLVKERV